MTVDELIANPRTFDTQGAHRNIQLPDTHLFCRCWCERRDVVIKKEWVGLMTYSCGRPRCRKEWK
jgi:hypothetical protein